MDEFVVEHLGCGFPAWSAFTAWSATRESWVVGKLVRIIFLAEQGQDRLATGIGS